MHILRSDIGTTRSDALGMGAREQATLGILNHVKLGNPWSGAGALLPGSPLASPLGAGAFKKCRDPNLNQRNQNLCRWEAGVRNCF